MAHGLLCLLNDLVGYRFRVFRGLGFRDIASNYNCSAHVCDVEKDTQHTAIERTFIAKL